LPAGQKPEYEFSCGEDLEERLGFDAAVQIQIYRIAQETISNICRHAAATRIQLVVQVVDGDFLLTLGDNGRGFDWTGKRTGSGRGLNNIRSRASLIDAQVRWRPNSGGGSTFTLRKKL